MKLEKLFDIDNLNRLIESKHIHVQRHPTLPLRILNYSKLCALDNVWPLEVCMCRGLIVDDQDNIISRPFMKFFNLGQESIFLTHNLDGTEQKAQTAIIDEAFLIDRAARWNTKPSITRKLDGWAGISYNYDGHWGVASRGSFTSPGALYATEKFQKFVKYGATEFIQPNTTLFFEIISKITRIVIPYKWEGISLLSVIHNDDGEELEYPELLKFWEQLNSYSQDRPWCRLVEDFDKSIQDCAADKDMVEEGYVVAIHRRNLPPIRAKIKLSEYCRLHHIVTRITPRKIWEELAYPVAPWVAINTNYDRRTKETTHDLALPKDFTAWVMNWKHELTKAFHEMLLTALRAKHYLEHHDGEEAQIREDTRTYFGDKIAKAAFRLHSGEIHKAYDTLWEEVRPQGTDTAFYFDGKGE